jgi:Na+/H+-dicarboxylate symporter
MTAAAPASIAAPLPVRASIPRVPAALHTRPRGDRVGSLVGILMSEARALTNLIGNGVATIVVAKWERALDERRMHTLLERRQP